MANRKIKVLLKGSGVPGKIPIAGDLDLKELAINFADVILYASGTTSNSILPIGWDRISRTGDTMTGSLFVPTISATTITALNFNGLPTDIYVTGGTYSSGTATFTNTTGGTFNITGFSTGGGSFTGGTVNGATEFTNGLTANTISATTYYNLPSTSLSVLKGVTILNFGDEDNYAITTINSGLITNTNINSITFIPSGTTETSLDDFTLNGISFNIENIIDNTSFDIRGNAINNASGNYTINYNIIY